MFLNDLRRQELKLKMLTLEELIDHGYEKLVKLDFADWNEFLSIFIFVLGPNIQKQAKRIFDPEFSDDPEISFIDFASEILEMSKSELRKLMKNNGIKVNNKPPSQDLKVKDIQWINLGEWSVAVIKIGKNRFDFIIK